MDHGYMDHSHMDPGHGGHGGHDMPSGHQCSMNMLFTWDTTDLCIVFRRWHVASSAGLVFSLLAVVLLAAGYEALRETTRRYENAVAKRAQATRTRAGDDVEPVPVTETTPFIWLGQNQAKVWSRAHVVKAVLYAAQNFYAFMIMLIFMTYNGWVMLAVAVGAFVGYLLFGNSTSATKETQCH